MLSSPWAGCICFESEEVEAAMGVPYRRPIPGAVKLLSKVNTSCWGEGLPCHVVYISTAFTELSISAPRQTSRDPYFSLSITITWPNLANIRQSYVSFDILVMSHLILSLSTWYSFDIMYHSTSFFIIYKALSAICTFHLQTLTTHSTVNASTTISIRHNVLWSVYLSVSNTLAFCPPNTKSFDI
jgi:hypothetical protein